MKKIIFLITLIVLLSSFVSAEIIINQQPQEIYNLGDTISIPVTIKSLSDLSGSLQMDLICEGHQINFYKNGVGLSSGEEKKMKASLILTKEMINELKGVCIIKIGLKDDYFLTNEFKISNLMTISITSEKTEFEPGKCFSIKGGVVKENKEDARGFIELTTGENSSANLNQLETINNGFFSINFTLPGDIKAGIYPLQLNAYEKDANGEITNRGSTSYEITIKQVATTLELFFENQEVEPGTDLKVKTILRDQTGEKIQATSTITITDSEAKILEQIEKPTEEFLEFPIKYNEASSEKTVIATSGKLTTESIFTIKEKEDIEIELINKTVIITNIGNVPYNKSILVKVGEESLNIDVDLEVDEIKKYFLTAPDGEYQVDFITEEGNKLSKIAILTGSTINIKEVSGGVISLMKYPFVWVFIIIILTIAGLFIFKKICKKSFFAYITKKRKNSKESSFLGKTKESSARDFLTNPKNKAELSLSIKGSKQDASIICLKIKNFKDIQKPNIKETLESIDQVVEGHKASVYENQGNLFFILAPIKTKTFKNEKTAIAISQEIQGILKDHNKRFKQKIDFGISLNQGAIIAKQEKHILKFMSMGNLITIAKKIASVSDEEILLSEKINNKAKEYIKTEKQNKENTEFYTIKEVKNIEGNKKFLRNFLKRIENKD
ncbi:hypothetical protein KAJ87_03995 [Candidatus Pacearchaeota archaeon]|nr:hypothetical protein [Candidatus Pacearchaeota archaeon]